jgi:hypothetical protein
VDLTTGPLANVPFSCAGRVKDPVLDSGQGAGSLVAGSSELPESDESTSLFLRLPAVALGAF